MPSPLSLVILCLGLLSSDLVFANDEKVNKDELAALAEPDLLPTRKEIPDDQNSYYKLQAFAEKHAALSDQLVREIEIGKLPDKVSREQAKEVLKLRVANLDVRKELLELSKARLQIPDKNPMLIGNSIAFYDLFLGFLTADAIYADQFKLSSRGVRELLQPYLGFAHALLHCEGGTIQNTIAINSWSILSDYINFFVAKGRLQKDDAKNLIAQAIALSPHLNDLNEVIKREYLYSDIWSIETVARDIDAIQSGLDEKRAELVFNKAESIAQVSKFRREMIAELNKKNPNFETHFNEKHWFRQYTNVPRLNKMIDTKNLSLDTLKTKADEIIRSNPNLNNYIGRGTLFIVTSTPTRILGDNIEEILKTKLKLLASAVLLYHEEQGKYPSSINDLGVAGILRQIPVNDLTTQTLSYSAKERSLKWVGTRAGRKPITINF